jgi:hypothetical protein
VINKKLANDGACKVILDRRYAIETANELPFTSEKMAKLI